MLRRLSQERRPGQGDPADQAGYDARLVQEPPFAMGATMNATTDMPMQATHSSPSSPVRDISASSGRYHPASRPVLPFGWWTAHRDYVIYMLRELSSVFIAIWALRFLVRLNRLKQGEDAYERAVDADRQPGWVLFNLAAFAFALLHAVTWFQLTG